LKQFLHQNMCNTKIYWRQDPTENDEAVIGS
jgi:hypothetical protein